MQAYNSEKRKKLREFSPQDLFFQMAHTHQAFEVIGRLLAALIIGSHRRENKCSGL